MSAQYYYSKYEWLWKGDIFDKVRDECDIPSHVDDREVDRTVQVDTMRVAYLYDKESKVFSDTKAQIKKCDRFLDAFSDVNFILKEEDGKITICDEYILELEGDAKVYTEEEALDIAKQYEGLIIGYSWIETDYSKPATSEYFDGDTYLPAEYNSYEVEKYMTVSTFAELCFELYDERIRKEKLTLSKDSLGDKLDPEFVEELKDVLREKNHKERD